MITKNGSLGVDEGGVEYDHGFAIDQIGRVSYLPEDSEGNYEVTFEEILLESDEPSEDKVAKIEVRVLSKGVLAQWFDKPTESFYLENIKNIPLK